MTHDELLTLLNYDPETGTFIWKERVANKGRGGFRLAGSEAGATCCGKRGKPYRRISVDSVRYFAHRLAWLYMTGEFPPDGLEVDHGDGDGLNNAWCNLSLATHKENMFNRGKPRNNSSGFKGVRKRVGKKGVRYEAQIGVNGKKEHIGTFNSAESASDAYLNRAREVAPTFARV